jgi:transcriptional regulator with XRE-family HTH domain
MKSRLSNVIDCLIGRRVCARRRTLNMARETLAARVGVSFQQLADFETGKLPIGMGKLIELAQALDEPVRCFLEDILEDAVPTAQHVPRALITHIDRDARDLVLAFHQIGEESGRIRVLRFAQSMAQLERTQRDKPH